VEEARLAVDELDDRGIAGRHEEQHVRLRPFSFMPSAVPTPQIVVTTLPWRDVHRAGFSGTTVAPPIVRHPGSRRAESS
jgi:hypothetical protein